MAFRDRANAGGRSDYCSSPRLPYNNGGGGGGGDAARRYPQDGGSSRGNRGGFGRGNGGRGGRGGPRAPPKPHVLSGEGAIFPIEVQPNSKAFRYDVSMEFKAPRDDGGVILVSLTMQKRDTRLRVLAYRILSIVMEATNNFGVPGMVLAYDNQNTLYSSKPFDPVLYNVPSKHLPNELQSYLKGSGNISVKITPNVEMPVVDISDLSQYESDDIVLDEDQTVRQVLEIILSQGAIDSGQYDVVGNGQLYRLQEKSLGRGLCTRIGTSKGVKIVEVEDPTSPTGKKICPGLIIDFKCSPFYSVKDRDGLPQQSLYDKVMECVRGSDDPHAWQEASRFFHGVKVVPVYDPHRVLMVKNFDLRTLAEITITIDDGQTMTLPEFFDKKKGCPLRFPNSRAVNISGDKGQFPMELLIILRNQRVSLEKVSPALRDMVHKANAVIPQERYERIMDEVSNMQFNNEITQAFGIRVLEAAKDIHAEKANDLEFERPPKPTIIVGDGIQIQPNDDGKFDLGKHRYFLPCKIDQWALVYSPECDPKLMEEFLKNFKQAAECRGMRFYEDPKRVVFDSRAASFKQWQDLFQNFKDEGTTFVLLIDSKSNTHSHNLLKLMESVSKILTQHVTLEVAQKVVEKYQVLTLGNILLKINVKNGGINYKVQFNNADRLDINTGNTLVISYDVCHPEDRKENFTSELRDPSVVGITANVLLDSSAFIGDFFYQAACQEKVDFHQLRVYVKNLLNILKKNKRSLPSIIVILRDGVSEGQFKMTYQEELPAIRAGFKDFDPDYNPEFVFVVCTKRHHKRFFEGENGLFENPQAGSFVNNFTRSDCIEFYMQCHKAIKGTAKFVQVSVVLNEPNVTKKELFGFLHSLSYGHQIVCSPVSLPTPIYQADELAARGFEIYHSVKQHMPHSLRSQNGEMMYSELSTLLNYSDTDLGNRRFNA